MVISTFPKNNSQDVVAALGEYDGKPTVSLWIFAQTRTGAKPTRQGISLSRDKLPELKAAVDALYEAERLSAAG